MREFVDDLWFGLVVIVLALLTVFTFGCTVEEPVKVITPSPSIVECDGKMVESWGKPSYDLDPTMKHQWGLGCAQNRQCERWPPKGTVEGQTECCLNLGVCVGV